MSLRKDLNITDELLSQYSPLGELSPKYLSQVLAKSSVVTFEAGEQVFEKDHAFHSQYYLLKGKLKVKKGVFSSSTLDASQAQAKNAINYDIPQGASVKATESGYLLLVDAELLDRALGWSQAEQDKMSESKLAEGMPQEGTKQNQEPEENPILGPEGRFDEEHFTWITSLMEFPLFFNLPPSNMETLLSKFTKVEVERGQVVIEEGDEGDYFYLLMKGSAKVIIGGDETRPIRLNKGSYFGEEALISDTVRSATVVMNEDGQLARLDKASFQSLLNDPLVKHVSKQDFEQETRNGAPFELLDIRSLAEFEHIPLPECLHIPLGDLRQQIPKLDKSKVYYLTEEGGHRSDVAAHILSQNSIKAKVIRS